MNEKPIPAGLFDIVHLPAEAAVHPELTYGLQSILLPNHPPKLFYPSVAEALLGAIDATREILNHGGYRIRPDRDNPHDVTVPGECPACGAETLAPETRCTDCGAPIEKYVFRNVPIDRAFIEANQFFRPRVATHHATTETDPAL